MMNDSDDEASTSSWESSTIEYADSLVVYDKYPRRTFRRIESDDPSLVRLELLPYHPTPLPPNEWIALGQNLGKNTHMKKLTITTDGLDWEEDEIASNENMEAFFSGLSQNRSLESLTFDHFNFERVRLETIHPFVMHNKNLVELLVHQSCMGTRDIELANAFGQRDNPTSIKSIGMVGVEKDESVGAIVQLCNWCPELRKLDLDFSTIGDQGCFALAPLLQNQNQKLRYLSIHNGKIGNEGALILANALANNKSLRCMGLCCCEGINERGWNGFLRLLCNTTSIDATNESNHHLEQLWSHRSLGGAGRNLPRELLYLLHANLDRSKTAVARKKIFHYHLNGDFSLAPFVSMDLDLLPNVLCFISKDYYTRDREIRQSRSSAFYRIIRSFPELCGFPSSERILRYHVEAENAALRADNDSLRQQLEKIMSVIEELKLASVIEGLQIDSS